MSESSERQRRGRGGNEVVIIYWRDIPAQVNGQRGRERSQIVLPERFQRAVDRAKRKAKIYTAHEDIAQWRRQTVHVDDDPFAAAERVAAELEAEYTSQRLGRLAFVGGLEADLAEVADQPIDRRELRELEELGEGDET